MTLSPILSRGMRFGLVCGMVALVPELALAQSSGYAPAYPPNYLENQPPQGSGGTPGQVTSVPIPAPAGSDAGNSAADLKYIAKPLAAPDLPANSPPRAYLRAAQAALATGQDGEAQQAMEMAQTRLLDRSVPLYQTDKPSTNPAVDAIGAALARLSAGDRAGAMQQLDAVLAMLGKK